MAKTCLNKNQVAAIVKLRAAYNEMYKLERRLGLEHQMIVNYHPKRYDNIRDVKNYKEFRTWQREGQFTTFTPEKKRKFLTDEQAIKAGYEPIVDAGRLYLIRYFEHAAEIRKLEIEQFLKSAYGSVEKAPEAIHMDLFRLGETHWQNGAGSEPTYLGKIWDVVNKAFRRSATIVRPAFLAKQAIGNFTQLYAEMGIDAFKMFQPETLNLALSILARDRPIFGFTDVWGIKYTAQEIDELLKRFPVRKNVAIEGIGQATEHRLIRGLTSDVYTQKEFRNFFSSSKNAALGMVDLARKGAGYLHWPAYLEDTYRLGAFFSAIKMGHSPAKAFEIVDKALFNYTSGLTRFEQSIRRGLVPFLTFQKFGMQLLLRTGMHTPGRIGVAGKTGRAFYEAWNKIAGGESLNESERKVIPPYLLEQPHVFEQFDKDGLAIFRTFNNMSFFDVVGFLQTDDKGDFSPSETIIRGGLAQLSPYIKVPLEIIFKRQFFSDRALEGAYAGNIGDVNADKLFRNLSAMAGLHGGAATGILGAIFGSIPNQEKEDTLFKRLVSWEENIDVRTGKRNVHVNPYIFLIATSLFPGLNEAVKASKNDRSFWDNVLSGAFGINVAKRDLSQDAISAVSRIEDEKNKALSEYRAYLRQGRLNSAEQALKDLEELLEFSAQEMEEINRHPIRGAN